MERRPLWPLLLVVEDRGGESVEGGSSISSWRRIRPVFGLFGPEADGDWRRNVRSAVWREGPDSFM